MYQNCPIIHIYYHPYHLINPDIILKRFLNAQSVQPTEQEHILSIFCRIFVICISLLEVNSHQNFAWKLCQNWTRKTELIYCKDWKGKKNILFSTVFPKSVSGSYFKWNSVPATLSSNMNECFRFCDLLHKSSLCTAHFCILIKSCPRAV